MTRAVNDSLGNYLKKERDPRQVSVDGKNKLNPFLFYNSPLSHARKATSGTFRRSDRMLKQAALAVCVVLIISLFFFIPSEYKGPEAVINTSPQNSASAEKGPVTQSAEKEPVRIIGNRDSKRYHLPGMKYYDQVRAYHRVIFESEEKAIEAGYRRAPR
jgi:hypothetical protein